MDEYPRPIPLLLSSDLDEITAMNVDWLWYPYLPQNKITFMAGEPGVGKSYVCMAIASLLSAGRPYPILNGREPSQPPPARVLYLFAEDDPADTIRPRMEAMHADLSLITVANGATNVAGVYFSLDHLDLLTEIIERLKPSLVVFDPIESFMGACNPNAAEDVRPRLDHLAQLAERMKFAVLAIRHNRKATAENALHKAAGSIAWIAAGRSFLSCSPDPDHPNTPYNTYGIVSHVKCNLVAKGPSLKYAIREGVFSFDGLSTLTADDLLASPKRSRSTLAKTFLREALAHGPRRSDELIKEAKEKHIAGRSNLFEAKKAIGIEADKTTFTGGWLWRLPTTVTNRERLDGGDETLG